MSGLPRDMEEEVLSRVPVRFLGEVRSTCKKWITLTRSESFLVAKKKQRKGIEVVMMLNHRVYLMSVDLLSPSIERIGNLNADGVDISRIFHCDGLILCLISKLKHPSRLLVSNPFLGQRKWIEPTSSYQTRLGYDKEKKEHKVLRFVNDYLRTAKNRGLELEIYSLHSNSWKAIYEITRKPYWHISAPRPGVSLKGNTYWYARESIHKADPPFLLCFDFTAERFGPRLPLPFHGTASDTISLSSVREEQLAVLYLKGGAAAPTYTVKIWITSKIEPNGVSWSNLFLAVDLKQLIGHRVCLFSGNFFLDEEKKVAVVLDITRGRNIAYVLGNNGYFKPVDLGEYEVGKGTCWPCVRSYVPSTVQIAPP
ncbi:hypothetical protein AALP_AA3G048600 [Arabis alpina]|uniref:Uncharacterized protein n=1 Tax=Arabis alpina TaxID=50452 RepID=A0A087H728_ARAAL|nr:hypothetical protein AALP_AA3G048600 [Arabis alpina]